MKAGVEVGRDPEGKGTDKAFMIVQMNNHENVQCSGNKKTKSCTQKETEKFA